MQMGQRSMAKKSTRVLKEPKGTRYTETTVKGGTVKRNAETGRFSEVRSGEGITKASPKSASALSQASTKRSSALKRLADR